MFPATAVGLVSLTWFIQERFNRVAQSRRHFFFNFYLFTQSNHHEAVPAADLRGSRSAFAPIARRSVERHWNYQPRYKSPGYDSKGQPALRSLLSTYLHPTRTGEHGASDSANQYTNFLVFRASLSLCLFSIIRIPSPSFSLLLHCRIRPNKYGSIPFRRHPRWRYCYTKTEGKYPAAKERILCLNNCMSAGCPVAAFLLDRVKLPSCQWLSFLAFLPILP